MSNLDTVQNEAPAINPAAGFASSPGNNGNNGAADTSDAIPNREDALKAFFKGMAAFGKAYGNGQNAWPFAMRSVFDNALTGVLVYTPTKAGKKSPTAVPTHIDLAITEYAEAARKGMKFEGASAVTRKSELNKVAEWASGKDTWEQATVLQEALDYHAEIVAANAKIQGHKGKTKVHSVAEIMHRLSVRQTDAVNADTRLSSEEIEACVLKTPGAGRAFKAKVEAFLKECQKVYTGTETMPATDTSEETGDMINAVNSWLAKFAINEETAKQDEMIAVLKAAGRI